LQRSTRGIEAARLDFLYEKPAAVLVDGSGRGLVSVFVVPRGDAARDVLRAMRNGCHVAACVDESHRFIAVADPVFRHLTLTESGFPAAEHGARWKPIACATALLHCTRGNSHRCHRTLIFWNGA